MIFTPTLSHDPEDALIDLNHLVGDLVEAGIDEILMVGTSLGGFYAHLLHNHMLIPAILINPAIKPSVTLKQWLGDVVNHSTGETFQLTDRHIAKFHMLENRRDRNDYMFAENLDVIIAEDDEIIPVDETIQFYQYRKAKVHVSKTGGHRFENMDFVYSIIEKKLASIRGHVDTMGDVDI